MPAHSIDPLAEQNQLCPSIAKFAISYCVLSNAVYQGVDFLSAKLTQITRALACIHSVVGSVALLHIGIQLEAELLGPLEKFFLQTESINILFKPPQPRIRPSLAHQGP
jgi:hypothetical protein